jgi:hypothetical protein
VTTSVVTILRDRGACQLERASPRVTLAPHRLAKPLEAAGPLGPTATEPRESGHGLGYGEPHDAGVVAGLLCLRSKNRLATRWRAATEQRGGGGRPIGARFGGRRDGSHRRRIRRARHYRRRLLSGHERCEMWAEPLSVLRERGRSMGLLHGPELEQRPRRKLHISVAVNRGSADEMLIVCVNQLCFRPHPPVRRVSQGERLTSPAERRISQLERPTSPAHRPVTQAERIASLARLRVSQVGRWASPARLRVSQVGRWASPARRCNDNPKGVTRRVVRPTTPAHADRP